VKKACLVVFFSLCLIFFSFSVGYGDQYLLQPGHQIYHSLEFIFTDCGSVSFGVSGPLSIGEIRRYINEVDFDSLSEAGKKEFNKIQSFLNQQYIGYESENMSMGINPVFTPEVFYKSNNDIEWENNYYTRDKLLSLPIMIGVSDFITFESDFFLGENFGTAWKNDNYTNIPQSMDSFDINFPKISYVSIGAKNEYGSFLNFKLGRGPLSVGKTQTGSIIFSENLVNTGYAQLSVFSPNIKVTSTVSELDVNKYLYYHVLDFRFFKKITFSMLEGVIVNAPLELRYLNPVMVFHGFGAWNDYKEYDAEHPGVTAGTTEGSRVGSYLAVSMQYTPVKNVRIYGLYAQNQLQTASERNSGFGYIPNAIAGQLGITLNVPVKQNYWSFTLEGVYTSPWMYILGHKNWSYISSWGELVGKNQSGTNVDSGTMYTWAGSPFGPDTVAAYFKMQYMVPEKWNIYSSYLLLGQGSNSDATRVGFNTFYYPNSAADFDRAQWTSPHSTDTEAVKITNKMSIGGSYYFSQKILCSLQISFQHIQNNNFIYNNTDFGGEISFSTQINLGVSN
jgi:hypothetical protein